jgi:hypothetical protein
MRAFLTLTFPILVSCRGTAGRATPKVPPSPLANRSVVGRSAIAYKASLDDQVTHEGRATVYFRQGGWLIDCFAVDDQRRDCLWILG